MDIATNPDTAPLLADAAPTPHRPPMIRREDYRPFPWLVPETRLEFELGLESTRVTATLRVERNPAAEASPTIRLNGDGLRVEKLQCDGADCDSHTIEDGDLIVSLDGDAHEIKIVTQVNPAANSQLMGLFATGGMLCTQCEAEGFRRITFFPDRPDVLSTYTVRMRGSKAEFPVLLANGNKVDEGADEGDGADDTHWAKWHDPWPKPSYLFALVAGDLVVNRDSFTTASGNIVDLAIYVRDGDLPRTDHAMRSLQKSMRWDEVTFGREYDLDVFNIVAVSDFNMGAMENKGLNVFNTKYVLADPETATDADFDGVEGVVAHEYFHNWSGNRVTCRDWFQLSLKEGFTVLRDQLFSQDMQGEAVKRIEDVRILRGVQFPEDSGPLAHPIRPDSFREISNFYTSTIYNKGAEVIRMMRTMCGPEAFRKATDLYFERHDGEAATCEDFITAMEDGAGLDLTQFRRWYRQAGTPRVEVALTHDGDTARVALRQTVPPTPGQLDKEPMPIPLKIALLDAESGTHGGEELIVLNDAAQTFEFAGFETKPVLSVNRAFSAPVVVERAIDDEELVFLAAHDDDPFARYEAMQDLFVRHLTAASGDDMDDAARDAARATIARAFDAIVTDRELDASMRGELIMLPSLTYLAEQQLVADPLRIHEEREGLKAWLGGRFEDVLTMLHADAAKLPFGFDRQSRGARKVKAQALIYLAAAVPAQASSMAARQYDDADNMTDRQGALSVLAGLKTAARTDKLIDFHRRYADNALVVDKWFALQASSLHPHAIDHVKALAEHKDFTMRNPNRVRSLYMAFAGNPHAFHAASGEGYRMITDCILALDPINPQTAARFVPSLGRWRRIEPERAAMMRAELERIAGASELSRDTYEQVTRSLGD
ncbi:MAG: aminopeptidase N [Pontixanthobacter sp.]